LLQRLLIRCIKGIISADVQASDSSCLDGALHDFRDAGKTQLCAFHPALGAHSSMVPHRYSRSRSAKIDLKAGRNATAPPERAQ
jgi:hypothetical protein